MDVLILIGSFTVACLAGMPVAYALGLAAILAALWTGIPLEAVMLKVSGGMSGFSLLAIPFFILAGAIMAEAALSFVGLGAQPPTPSWGAMVADGRDLLRVAPWVSFAPGIAIGLAVLGFNLVGDALREAFDPKVRSEQ